MQIRLTTWLLLLAASYVRSAPPVQRDSDLSEGKLYNISSSEKKDSQVDRPIVLPKKQPEIVRRPDHLDAVPLERDGHLNKQFRQEIFFGETKTKGNEDVAGPQRDAKDAGEHLLMATFYKADKDGDGHLTKAELEQWIQETTLQHLDEAIQDTKRVLALIDQNQDGYATWDEYHYHFLIDNKLMDPSKAKKHDEEHGELSPEDQEKIENEIEEWHEADQDPKDGQLSEREFLAFRHPEHSDLMLKEMVKDILKSLDADNDGRLSENEFVAVSTSELEDSEWAEAEKEYLSQRRREFKELIDVDGDQFADFKELLQYTNPRNVQHAKREVDDLMQLADEDEDQRLSLDEVLKHKSAFFGSRMMDPGKNMHDEF